LEIVKALDSGMSVMRSTCRSIRQLPDGTADAFETKESRAAAHALSIKAATIAPTARTTSLPRRL
jgi:hypothetical protein